jgi:hypothetical protein
MATKRTPTFPPFQHPRDPYQRLCDAGFPAIAHYLATVMTWGIGKDEEVMRDIEKLEKEHAIATQTRSDEGAIIEGASATDLAIMREYIAVIEDLLTRLGSACREVAERSDFIVATARNAAELRVYDPALDDLSER